MKFNTGSFTKVAAVLLCSTVLFCGCAKNSDVAIKVNDKNITRGEFYSDFNKIKNAQLKNAPKEIKKDGSYAVLAMKERFVNDIVIKTLLNQEFEKRGLTASPDEIEAKKAQIIVQIGSEEQFKNLLKENHISDEKLNNDMAAEVKMDKLVQSLNIKEATDAEALKFYNENKAQFQMPERVQVSHILINANPEDVKRQIADADKEANLSTADIDSKVAAEVARKEALAKEIQAKAAKNPKDFAKLAKEYSEDAASAEKGGDLGYVTRETLVKEFADAAFNQKVGTVSPLVKSQFGYHIILVKDKAAKGTESFAKVKTDLKAYLSQQKKFAAIQGMIEGLKNSATIEYVDESLNPENIRKQLDEALKKQMEKEQKDRTPQTKQKALEENEQESAQPQAK